ncbi:hypothetical protein CDL15_Pgr008598 [Punica granatum]|uniref:Uncharacterized protein n=1 Tax=Punica granatum TaxID=22663 RepID=A0A218WN67_PUNGR|nr:hypothetical protein CDL15_Pgr008598 [Punica granatum]
MGDPLDCVFGESTLREEIHDPTTSTASPITRVFGLRPTNPTVYANTLQAHGTRAAVYIWKLEKSLDSSVNNILALEGSRYFVIDNVAHDQSTSEAATGSRRDQPYHDSRSHRNHRNKPQITSSDSPGAFEKPVREVTSIEEQVAMGDALVDLEQVLVSKQDLTRAEANIMLACKARAIKDFTVGACVGSGVVWAGAAVFLGLWKFGKSLDSSVDNILALEGSRMQRELASIIVKKYQDNPRKMHLISKHFYSEEVFDDSTPDKPKLRWRYRNFFSDNVAHGQSTSETDTKNVSDQPYHSRSHWNPQNKPQINSSNSPNSHGTEETKLEVRRSPINAGVDMMGDPLVYVFGESTTKEEIHLPTTSAASSKAQASRSRRRHSDPMGVVAKIYATSTALQSRTKLKGTRRRNVVDLTSTTAKGSAEVSRQFLLLFLSRQCHGHSSDKVNA